MTWQTLCVGRFLYSCRSISRQFSMEIGPLLTGKIGWVSNPLVVLFGQHPRTAVGFPLFAT